MLDVCRWVRPALLCTTVAVAAPAATGDAHAQCGTRFVAKTGSDAANSCLSAAGACATLTHAADVACAGDLVSVAEGTYVEDVVIAKRVSLDSSGANANTILRGTGSGDNVTLLASGISFNGFTMTGPAGGACLRIGDAAHPGVRGVQVTNSEFSGCAAGVLLDAIGTTGDYVRINGNVFFGAVAGGGAGGGAAVAATGGAGRLSLILNTIRDNAGPALRIDAAGPGANRTIAFVGNTVLRNARGASSPLHAAIEVHGATDVRIEGNEIGFSTGLPAPGDGRAVLLDGVSGGNFFCNRVHDNDGGLELAGGTSAIAVLHNRFSANSDSAVIAQPGSTTGVAVNEDVFSGNGRAVLNLAVETLDARHSWWGAADGPSGAGGSGDAVSGPVDVSHFIARADTPVLARGATDFGWSPATAACFDTLQGAFNAAPVNGLVLVGAARLNGRAVLDGKRLDIEGLSGGPIPTACPPSVVDGTQSGGTRVPNIQIKNVSGVTMTNLTVRGAGLGVPCFGGHQDTEIGLDLQNVKNSSFRNLCVEASGTTEIRVFGDSDDNLFETVLTEGMIRDHDGDDLCGHRARDGFFIDGGPACEGGPGAFADRNRLRDVTTFRGTREIRLRLARGTVIENSFIHGVPSSEWDAGDVAYGIQVQASDDTYIHDNREIGNRGMKEAIRIEGLPAGSCVTENRDSRNTRIENNLISMVENAYTGIRLVGRAGDLGHPLGTRVACTKITGAFDGVVAEHVGAAPGPVNRFELVDIYGNTNGVRNTTADTLPVTRSWWEDPSGPSGAGPGTGDSVSSGVDYSGFLASSALDDADGDGWTECAGDADDVNPLIKPVDTCDGFDNDQDGTLDEDFVSASTSCGVGACRAGGVTSCAGGVVQDSCVAGTPGANDATCDNVDDDCDGSVDENYPSQPTTCGVGACGRSGAISCVAGVVQDTCTAGAPAADDSLCNGLDDDCDGAADEDFAPRASSCGRGVCGSTGTVTCAAGREQDSCVAGPPAAPQDTLCNGLDDDCDGSVDEDYVVDSATCGLGVCRRSGTSSCVGGIETQACTPGPPTFPTDVACNGDDDDCDGAVDEDFEPGPSSCGRGICVRVGQLTCVGGHVEDSCVPGPPAAETCNALDDDCDGTLDNGLTDVAYTCGAGVCVSTGVGSCVNGLFEGSCVPGAPLSPDDATCDGVDDNCNGTSDEDYAGVGTTCGTGACAAAGVRTCVAGVPGDTCTPGQPAPESCDGVDNDCNAVIDDPAPPSSGGGLTVVRVGITTALSWDTVAAATGYDVVTGSLSPLLASAGSFSAATTGCLGNDVPLPTVTETSGPPDPGEARWYLVRAVNCGGPGSYDDGGALAASRDPGIGASGVGCP